MAKKVRQWHLSTNDEPASGIQHPVSSIQHPASSIQYPASSIPLISLSIPFAYIITNRATTFSYIRNTMFHVLRKYFEERVRLKNEEFDFIKSQFQHRQLRKGELLQRE